MGKEPSSVSTPKTYLVTQALPYANGEIHLGHLVEAVQTDIFVRYQKLRGNRAVFVCADDTHGTPIELTALKKGISPEDLIASVWESHTKDYGSFAIGFDVFYSTNSPENRRYAEYIYQKLREKGLVIEREVTQYFCEHDKRFLPDRFVVGTCPKCGATDQYGDVCEACGTTYDPTDLKDPVCIICRNQPVLRTSNHMFVQLGKREEFLRQYISEKKVVREDMKNFVTHWIDDGLKEWCISRDGPYFGFEIPDAPGKYFYVWLDAPIGYLSSTEKWCKDHGQDVATYWGKNTDSEVVHFIGKDIVYFHALFWPVMLESAEFKLPSKIHVHGFLTIGGEKMSKSRGTFILARDYIEKVEHPQAPEYLRFFFGSKLADTAGDIDLNAEEFCSRINTVLANNIGNLHHRTFVFCAKYFDGKIPDAEWDPSIEAEVEKIAQQIAQAYETVEYRTVIEKIQYLGSLGNKYYQDRKPWESVKTDKAAAAKTMTTCANLVRALAVFLKPVVPAIAASLERQFGVPFTWDDYRFSLRDHVLQETEKLVKPIEPAHLAPLFEGLEESKKDESEEGLIDITAVQNVDLRVVIIEHAERVKKSNKLLKLQVSLGDKKRQVIAGIGQHYAPEELPGKQVVMVANLKPASLMGEKSEGMLLAAQEGKRLVLLQPSDTVSAGAKIS